MSSVLYDDEDNVKRQLLQWSNDNVLNDVIFENEQLIYQGYAISSLTRCTIELGNSNKTCQYSAGSIYLQIINPSRGLLDYRNACKRYSVSDPIKALDKPTVVGYFENSSSSGGGGGADVATATTAPGEDVPASQPTIAEPSSSQQLDALYSQEDADATKDPAAAATAAASTTAEDGAVVAEDTTDGAAAAAVTEKGEGVNSKVSSKDRHKDRHHHRSKSDDRHRDRDRDRRRSSKDKHHRKSSSGGGNKESPHHKRKDRDHHDRGDRPAKKKKAPKALVTNEELFACLNVVVDKRQQPNNANNMDQAMTDADADAEDTEINYQLINMQEQISKALSADGFVVTPELLDQHKERTNSILSNETPVGNSASILRAVNPRKDLSRVLELFLETTNTNANSKASLKSSKHGAPRSSMGSSGSPAKAVEKAHLKGKNPVIIVPKAMTAPLTMINANEFFSKGRFVPRDVMLKQLAGGGGRSAARLGSQQSTFTRDNVRGATGVRGTVQYDIVDAPARVLRNDRKEWDRVVAVVVLGQTWQFKDWPSGYNTPATLFDRVQGFFIGMEGDRVPPDVGGWAVKKSKLNRDKRGLDSVTFASFWNTVDEWMRVRKAELLPQIGNNA